MTPSTNWIHSFAVTDAKLHRKGYTIYKITSIVFPRSIPQALTCITIWKRFHDVKKLHRELSRRHKNLQLSGQLPEPTDSSFFKRFDEDVIRRRKIYIQHLLEFAAEHPSLYKCHAFTQFFNDGVKHAVLTPEPSPEHHLHIKFRKVNKNGGISVGNNLHEIDAFFNICDKSENNGDNDEFDKNLPFNLLEIDKNGTESNDETAVEDDVTAEKSRKDFTRFLTPMASIESEDNDYIYDAALEFSNAVQSEANLEYNDAYTKYKFGVEILLIGSKDDNNEERKFIAKAKISKYLARSEEIYDKFLRINTCNSPKNAFQLSVDVCDNGDTPNLYLERPWNHLTKYKVLQILGNRVMQVQSITERLRPIYIMKGIEKPPSNSSKQTIFLPQHVPFMVNLLAFFQSKYKLFLLLKQAEGGRLYDYIQNYKPSIEKQEDNMQTIDIQEYTQDVELLSNNSAQDSGFVDTNCGPLNSNNETDLNDIVKSSKKLLDSVSNTLKNLRKLDETPDVILNEENVEEEEGIEAKENIVNDEMNIDAKEIEEEVNVKTMDINGIVAVENIEENNIVNEKLIETNQSLRVPEACLKKWSCQLAIAIHSLHCKSVILGDLHMENLLVDEKGQLLLTYFYQHENHEEEIENSIHRTYNLNAFGGHFVAPERKLTCKSDWWSYGIILYQLYIGLPFKNIHPGAIFLYGSIQYPDNIDISDDFRDLLENLLQQAPEERLDYDQIQAHAYFKDINWNDIHTFGVNQTNLLTDT